MNKKDILKFLVVRTIGNFLVLFMIFGFFATFGPALYFEANYQIEQSAGIRYQVASAATITRFESLVNQKGGQALLSPLGGEAAHSGVGSRSAKIDENQSLIVTSKDPNVRILIPKSLQFSVIIPKIGINERVFPNVDPSNPDEYLSVLKRGVAHAKGSAFPGLNGTTYIFAHSTDNFWDVGRYNAIFYLLGKLDKGDDVIVFFRNKRYNYQVAGKQIVDAADTQYISANIGKGERLILQTCWPPGTTWKRLLIFAEPKTAGKTS